MATKKISKPKYQKLPAKPKSSAPLSAWEKWHERAKAVQKNNSEKKKDYEKKMKDAKSSASKKSKLIEAARKVTFM